MYKIQKWLAIAMVITAIGMPQIYGVYADKEINDAATYSLFLEGSSAVETLADSEETLLELTTIEENSLLATSSPSPSDETPNGLKTTITRMVAITAYSSSVWQTDSSPFVTASGNLVRDGIIAANFLPFGAKVKLPEFYGNKVFTVEDRMAKRYWYHVDIWMPSHGEAKNFGVKYTNAIIEI